MKKTQDTFWLSKREVQKIQFKLTLIFPINVGSKVTDRE